jgi:DNA polymerase-3 subunit gamma/tau
VLRESVLKAVGGQPMLVNLLGAGEWKVEGNELVIKVAASPSVIDMSVSAEAKRLIIGAARGVLGRAAKLKVLPGGTPQTPSATARSASNGGGRARAEQDPIVRRMQEKFGAEIRTIIDYRDKR